MLYVGEGRSTVKAWGGQLSSIHQEVVVSWAWGTDEAACPPLGLASL